MSEANMFVFDSPESSAEREEEDAGAEEGAQGSELHQTEDGRLLTGSRCHFSHSTTLMKSTVIASFCLAEAAPERAQTDPEATDTEKNDPEDPRSLSHTHTCTHTCAHTHTHNEAIMFLFVHPSVG